MTISDELFGPLTFDQLPSGVAPPDEVRPIIHGMRRDLDVAGATRRIAAIADHDRARELTTSHVHDMVGYLRSRGLGLVSIYFYASCAVSGIEAAWRAVQEAPPQADRH